MQCSEKVTLDATKTFVSLIGTDTTSTIITWNQIAGDYGYIIGSATIRLENNRWYNASNAYKKVIW
jgi:hypothetical protein